MNYKIRQCNLQCNTFNSLSEKFEESLILKDTDKSHLILPLSFFYSYLQLEINRVMTKRFPFQNLRTTAWDIWLKQRKKTFVQPITHACIYKNFSKQPVMKNIRSAVCLTYSHKRKIFSNRIAYDN